MSEWLPASAMYRVQPDWSKRLLRMIGYPALVLMMLSLLSGVGFDHEWVPISLFAIWAIVALMANVVFFKARERGRADG